MKLIVTICSHNRAELLMSTISSLNRTSIPLHCKIKILVIANACTDDTINQLKKYQLQQKIDNTLPLIFAEEPKTGKSHALNHAINLVQEKYCCFVDDDHRVDENFFCAISSAIEQYPNASILCGQIIPDWTGKEPEWIHDQGKYKIYPLPVPHFELGSQPSKIHYKTRLPGGGNLIVHKDVFSKVGKFSTALGPRGHNLRGSEDSDYILRALDVGLWIQYVPKIIQYHYVDLERLKLGYLVLKSYQRTQSMTLARHPGHTSIPLYLWRKLINNGICIILSFTMQKYRFYLMRLAATAGEIIGFMKKRD